MSGFPAVVSGDRMGRKVILSRYMVSFVFPLFPAWESGPHVPADWPTAAGGMQRTAENALAEFPASKVCPCRGQSSASPQSRVSSAGTYLWADPSESEISTYSIIDR